MPAAPIRPSRRGECGIAEALSGFLGAEPTILCGNLPRRAPERDFERMRICVVDAMSRRKAFAATWTLQGIDSTFEDAFAGRTTGAGYEVRWYLYDSCPSGCGDDNPAWWGEACHPLLDLRVACASRKRGDADEDLHRACEVQADGPDSSDPRRRARWLLGLYCDRPVHVDQCPSQPEAPAP